jgi:hypothetical protein
MRTVNFTCNQCTKVKGETNHWFGVRYDSTLKTITIMPFEEIPEELMDKFEHTCGSGCLLKRVDAMVVTL